jgi:KaiC/GvpD/RAD55 family RecA-like ATPase
MMSLDEADDFGGEQLPIVVPSNVIPFPTRANAKLHEQWSTEVARANATAATASKRLGLISPLDALDDLIRKRAAPPLPFPKAWPELGKRARLYTGEILGVVGPTGGGKTSFAIQMAIAAMADGIPVLWNPKELDAPELDLRIVANMMGIHTSRVRDDWPKEKIANALANIDDLWRFVDNVRDLEGQLDAYRTAIRLAKRIYGRPPLLVIDYVGKFARGARDPRLAIADASDEILHIIRSEEAFAIMLAQPSRSNNANLTGKNDFENATDSIQVAGESSEIEHACSVMLGLSVFKADDQMELDAHVLVAKARATGREGREGFRFSKPGGVWRELDYVPATPIEIAAKLKKDKKDKSRHEPPTKASARSELNVEKADDANGERRRRIHGALTRAGISGMTIKELEGTTGAGRGQRLQQSLQELERSGDAERTMSGRWRVIGR